MEFVARSLTEVLGGDVTYIVILNHVTFYCDKDIVFQAHIDQVIEGHTQWCEYNGVVPF
jgi:hypothetical protein